MHRALNEIKGVSQVRLCWQESINQSRIDGLFFLGICRYL